MRKIAILLTVVLFLLMLLPSAALAETEVYFASVNNEILPLEDSTMPITIASEVYVPTVMLTYGSSPLTVSYYKDGELLTIMGRNKQLVFDLRMNTSDDGTNKYTKHVMQRNSSFYVPAAFVFDFFEFDYTLSIETPYGKMCRLRTGASYNDGTFVSAMEYVLREEYNNYVSGGSDPEPNGEQPSDVSPTPEPTPEPVREVYLTFDDGPHRSYTEELLDVLDEYGVKATFFVQGSAIAANERSGEILRRTVGSGHAVGVHSYTHIYEEVYASPESVIDEMERTNDLLYDAIMERTRIVRMPFGSKGSNAKPGLSEEQIEALREYGYRFWDWNVDAEDSLGKTTPETIYNTTITQLDNYALVRRLPAIVLMHDKEDTVKALPMVLDYLMENNYTFHIIRGYDRPVNSHQNIN